MPPPANSDPTMCNITIDEKNHSYVVESKSFQPTKQRFGWKKFGKDEALKLAKKARDDQVEKRKHNAQLEKERRIEQEQIDLEDHIAWNKVYYEKQCLKDLEEAKQRAWDNLSPVAKLIQIHKFDCSDETRRLVIRDMIALYGWVSTDEKAIEALNILLERYKNPTPFDIKTLSW
jgi:hypothetical protein